MRDDEFTNSKSNNDSFISKTEYGNLPENEFSDSGEMNLHKAAYDASLMKSQNTKTVEDVTQGATGAESTVASTSAASSVSAAAISTVAVASTVAIGALGVLAGISVTLHDYEVKFNSFIVCSDQVRYELSIKDNNMTEEDYEHYWDNHSSNQSEESSLPFVIRIYNLDYDSSQELFFFEQSGYFENLTLGETYNIVISENRYGGETLYENVFTTKENTSFFDYSLTGRSDFENGTFEFYMDFIDERDVLDNFAVDLYEPEASEKILAHFDLLKQSEIQNVSYLDVNNRPNIDIEKEYGYTFSYTNDGQKVEETGVVSFFDAYGRTSNFTSFEFDKTMNFITYETEVQLNYVDYFGWYDDFVWTLTAHYGDPDGTTGDSWDDEREIELESTNEPQTINMMEQDLMIEDATFTYVLTCNYRGETMTLVEETEPFKFTDNSGGVSEFNGLIFDKTANFLTKKFNVQLDYQDDFSYYDEFVFSLWPNNGVNAKYDWTLENTTEVQTLEVDEQEHYLFSFDYDYTYALTCYYRGMETTLVEQEATTFKFTDNSGAKSGFNKLIFDGTYSYPNHSFDIQLDFDNDYGYYDNFIFVLADFDDPDYTIEIELDTTVEVQTIDMNDHDINTSDEIWYTYTLYCDYRGEQIIVAQSEDGEEFQWQDPNSKSEVTGMTFVNNEANFGERSFYIQLDFQDDYGVFYDFHIKFWGTNDYYADQFGEDELMNEFEVWLDKTTRPQKIVLDGYDNDYMVYNLDFVDYNLGYNLYWEETTETDAESHCLADDFDSYLLAPKFTDIGKSEVYGVDTRFEIFPSQTSADDYCMYLKLNIVDDYKKWSLLRLVWRGEDEHGGHFIDGYLDCDYDSIANQWIQYRVIMESDSIESLCDGEEHEFALLATYKDENTGEEFVDTAIWTTTSRPTLVDSPTPELLSSEFAQGLDLYGDDSYAATAMPFFAGDESLFVDFSFTFEDEDTGDKYTITYEDGQFSNYMMIDLSKFDDGPINAESWEGKYFTISAKYCILTEDPENPGSTVKSDPVTVVLATNQTFIIRHQTNDIN